ncbi:MAG: hypothetical protein ACFB15_12070 [Cyclobacteriaceae bacterium]
MKLLVTACLVVSGITGAFAQDKNTADKQQILDQVAEESIMGSVQTFDNRYEGVKGNPFLYEDWQKGSFDLTDGSTHENLLLRFDVLSDELHFQNRMKVASVVPQDRLKKFILKGEKSENDFHFMRAKYLESLDSEVKPNKIVQVLHENDFQMVAVRYKVVKKADYEGGYSRNKPYDEITEVAPKYYLLKPGQEAEKIKPKKKALLKALPDHADTLEALLESEQYDLANPNEVARLLNQLN